jgi:fluoroquinolone resistance protein
MIKLLKQHIRSVVSEMSTRYKRETGKSLPRWQQMLVQYEKQGGLFVHFSRYPKLGLNPLNEFNTPTGFYMYPLDTEKIAPFAIGREYAIVCRIKPDVSILNVAKYREDELRYDISILKNTYSNKIKEIDATLAKFKTNKPGERIWQVARTLSRGTERTLPENPAAADATNPFNKQVINDKNRLLGLIDDLKLQDKTWQGKSFSEKREVLIRSWETRFPNLPVPTITTSKTMKTGEVAEKRYFLGDVLIRFRDPQLLDPKKLAYPSNPEANNWSNVFKNLGYDGVLDEGTGIIYADEPDQVVIFDSSNVELVDVIKKGSVDFPFELTKVPASGRDMSGLDLSGENITREKFVHSNMTRVDFTSAEIRFCDFIRTNCEYANFNEASIEGCDFTDANLSHSKFSNSTLESNNFFRTTIRHVIAGQAQFTISRFESSKITDSSFQGAKFTNCGFINTVFNKTTMTNANFKECDFSNATLSNCDLSGCTFTRCNFGSTSFEKDPRGYDMKTLGDATFLDCILPPGYEVDPVTNKLKVPRNKRDLIALGRQPSKGSI